MAAIRGTNNIEVRVSNRKNVVFALHQYGAMTKQELADRMKLSLPTISVILKELTEEGLVTTGGTLESSGGRKPLLNMLAADAKFAIGIGITHHHIRMVLVDLGISVVRQYKQRILFENSDEYWAALHGAVDGFIAENVPDPARLIGIGISLPGIVRPDHMMVFAPTLNVRSIDLIKLADSFEQDVEVANDAKLAGFAQIFMNRRQDSCVYLMLNKGVGGAIIADGQVVRVDARAAEFGHMTIVNGGRRCSCGKLGCLEAYCSSGVLREASGMDLDEFFKSLREGDEKNTAIWNEYMEYLALSVNNLRVIFDTNVFIGGEMSEFIREYEAELRVLLEERNPFREDSSYLRIGDYGEFASTVGAALIQMNKFLS